MKNKKYLDNAATSHPKAPLVYAETMSIYSDLGTNFTRNKSEISNKALELVKKLKENLKEIFSSKGDIILNASATQSLNEVIRGLDYSKIKEVYISPFEHNAVYRTLNYLKEKYNFNLNIIPFEGYRLKEEDLKLQFMSKKPDLIVCLHASNVFGNILDIETIFTQGKKYNATTVLDAVQSGGVLNFEKISPLCDFIVFAGHKSLYGPSGIGGYIYNNKNIKVEPLIYGGTGIKSEEIGMPSDIPEKYQAGTPNILGMIGLKLSTDWILEMGIENIRKKDEEIFEKLLDLLEDYEDELEYSVANNRIGVVSVTPLEYTPQELGNILEASDIYTRTGMHCSPLAHKHMKTDKNGTLRFSISYFTRDEDLEALEEVLENIL